MLTYTQRNALAKTAALPPLAKGALTYTPGKPQFSTLVAGTLGNVGTAADGFDSLFSAVASTVDGDISSLGTLDTILRGLVFTQGALDLALFAPLAVELDAVTRAGDATLNAIGKAVGVSTNAGPAPVKVPPPPQQPPRPINPRVGGGA